MKNSMSGASKLVTDWVPEKTGFQVFENTVATWRNDAIEQGFS